MTCISELALVSVPATEVSHKEVVRIQAQFKESL
jgi:hypothetical protein